MNESDDFPEGWSMEELEDGISHIASLRGHPGYRMVKDELDSELNNNLARLIQETNPVLMHQMQGKIQGLTAGINAAEIVLNALQQEIASRKEEKEQNKARKGYSSDLLPF
jgi:hypothetical protein